MTKGPSAIDGGPAEPSSRTVEYSLDEGYMGWQPGFADYTVGEYEVINPLHGHEALPDGLEGSGVFLEGRNASADLFMFLRRRIKGLVPDTDYRVTIEVEFASKYQEGLFGIGGSPGESVHLKVGATAVMPERVQDGHGMWRMYIDMGNQARGGSDAVTVGNIAKPEDGTEDHVILRRNNTERPIHARTDAEGGLWVLVGTDSGFEGVTRVYYTRIVVNADPVTSTSHT